jgi:hypothetical protein
LSRPISGAARIDAPPAAALDLVHAAIGGGLAGLLFLILLLYGAHLAGHAALSGANALGAFFVRWLQDAAPQALNNFYPDATLSSLLIAPLVGAGVGAAFAAFLTHLPEDRPLAWGGVMGVLLWLAGRWSILPALDPVLIQQVDGRVLFAAFLLSGLALGAWIEARPGRWEAAASGGGTQEFHKPG